MAPRWLIIMQYRVNIYINITADYDYKRERELPFCDFTITLSLRLV